MLNELHVTNFLFIDEARLEFSPALNAITGETGAGKSVLLESIKLLAGKRGRTGLVLDRGRPARVQGVFAIATMPEVKAALAEAGLANDDDPDLLTISRTFKSEGSGQCWINGILTQTSQLQRIGQTLVEIHGQNEHQSLLQPTVQRHLLDRLGDRAHQANLSQLKQTWTDIGQRKQALRELEERLQRAEERLDELRQADQTLSELALTDAEEPTTLLDEEKKLAHAEEIATALKTALDAFDGDEHGEATGARALLQRAREALRRIRDHGTDLAELANRLEDVVINLTELGRDTQRATDDLVFDPLRLDTVQRRLATISQLCRRYRCEPAALMALHADIRREIGELSAPDTALRKHQQELAAAEQRFRELAETVGEGRRKLARQLARSVTAKLPPLGFPRAGFEVRVNTGAAGPNGCEEVAFWVALNPGAPAAPMARVASGGELSRLALAIRTVLAECDDSGFLVFDEIDAGVGGTTAEQVAANLAELSRHRQVLLVTHLHQIAKEADRHFTVEKSVANDSTRVTIQPICGQAREHEIARMLGTPTQSGRQFARTLLDGARRDASPRPPKGKTADAPSGADEGEATAATGSRRRASRPRH